MKSYYITPATEITRLHTEQGLMLTVSVGGENVDESDNTRAFDYEADNWDDEAWDSDY